MPQKKQEVLHETFKMFNSDFVNLLTPDWPQSLPWLLVPAPVQPLFAEVLFKTFYEPFSVNLGCHVEFSLKTVKVRML